jgi:hypothetical protein
VPINVRFARNSCQNVAVPRMTLCAISGLMHRSKSLDLETCKDGEAAKNHCGSDPSRGLFIERG